jgi:predicted nucleic acid-binding protein
MAWLLDTNILSELRRLKPEPKVLGFIAQHSLDDLYISVVSLAELRFGIELLADESDRRNELNNWLTHYVRPMFHERILPITEDVMLQWRILVEHGRKAGYTYSQPDLIIAATGLHYGLTIVTRNRTDFDKAGVPVVNPWEITASDLS